MSNGFAQHEPEAEWALNIWTEWMNECVLNSSSSFNANNRLDTQSSVVKICVSGSSTVQFLRVFNNLISIRNL